MGVMSIDKLDNERVKGSLNSNASFIEDQTVQAAHGKSHSILASAGDMDPGEAILFFIFTANEGLLDKDARSIDDISNKIDGLTAVYTKINELKELFSESKEINNLDTNILNTNRFKEVIQEIETKINDPEYSELKEQMSGALNDMKAIAALKTLHDVWEEAERGKLSNKDITFNKTGQDGKIGHWDMHIPKEIYDIFLSEINKLGPSFWGPKFNVQFLSGDKANGVIHFNTLFYDPSKEFSAKIKEIGDKAIDEYEKSIGGHFADLNKMLSSLDTAQTVTSSISKNTQAMLSYRSSEFNEHLNLVKVIADQVTKARNTILQNSK